MDYSYQDKSAELVLKNALDENNIAGVLAAAPGSGKTTISHKIINKYLELYPDAKVVVLTHGQNTLMLQYLDELEKPNIPINFTYGVFGQNSQVQVGLPQSIQHYNKGEIDLLVVDEAHQWYFSPTGKDIIDTFKPKHQVLMTGSPSEFTRHNGCSYNYLKYGIHYVPANKLIDNGVFSDVDLTVTKTDKNSPKTAIKDALIEAEIEDMDVSKLMVACPSIAYAKEVTVYLESIGRVVALSTSESNGDEEIDKFKDNQADVLVVVNKGILGFNDKEITCLVDLKSSKNIDTSYQLFARVLRTHPEGIRKGYIRIANSDYNNQVLMLHKMLALMNEEVFRGYNGKNLEITIDMGY